MTPEPMPEPEGPEDERFVYMVAAAGLEAVRQGAVAVDSEREPAAGDLKQLAGTQLVTLV